MWALLVEGLASAWLPCSLVLLVPGAAAVAAAGRHRLLTLAGFTGAIALFGWLRFSARLGDLPTVAAAMALMAAAALLLVPVLFDGRRHLAPLPAIGGLFAGGAAAQLWEPCVGAEFGALLTDLPSSGGGAGAAMTVYVLGVLSPLLGLAALLIALPERSWTRATTPVAVAGGAALAVLALVTAAGFHEQLVGRLLQLSVS